MVLDNLLAIHVQKGEDDMSNSNSRKWIPVVPAAALLLLTLAILAPAASATDIYVNQTGWWNATGDTTFHAINPGQIQAAIDNADAGDTIYVWNGTYNENVKVDKHLTLEGEGAGVVTVTAEAANDHVFDVTADCVNISGFTVTGATGILCRGICLNSAQHCKISENNASGNRCGICLYYSHHNTLTKNTANSNGCGICLWLCSSNNDVSCNWVQNNTEAGFCLAGGSTNNMITNNSIIANGDMQGDGSYQWQFRNDQFKEVSTADNWWGTADTAIINASIHDWTCSWSESSVTTDPRLSGSAPCAPVPELPTILLLAVGLSLLAGYVRIERRK